MVKVGVQDWQGANLNVKSDVNSENLKNVGQKNSASKETGFSSGKSVNGFLEQLVAHSSDFTFNPETVRRIAGDIKAQIISEHEKEEFSSTRFDFSINQKLHDSLIRALEEDSIKLPIVDYSIQNYYVLFPQGYVETPIETLKMGENQFQKFKKSDRDYLMAAAYQTLTTPSLIFDSMSLDSKSGNLKPVRVYGKSFYRENKDKSRAVESVIIFREENNIVIGTHNKDFSRFVNQIKTADQIIYADKTVSRVCELAKNGRTYVRTEGENAQSLNRNYNKSSVLSISDLIKNKRLSVTHIEPEKSSYFKEQEMDKVNEKRILDPEEIGEQLAELDSKTWNELGIESGSDFTGHPEKIKSYASSIKDYLDANGIKELDRETFSFLEAINYHTLNNILGLHGVYGEEFRRRAIERADSPYSNYDRNTALEIVNGIDREEILDKGIERMQENGGVSDSAAEAEMNARDNLRADYLDADGNPHWFDEEEEQAEEQEIEEDTPAPAESTITEGNLYPDDVNSATTKFGDIVRETFLSLSDDEKEAGTTTDQKYTRYEKWHRPMIDEIMASVIAGDQDLLRKIRDFDLNKASHKEGNSYYSEDEAFKRDVNYKLLPELYEIIQDKIIEKYNQDKTPYVMLNWSESPVFPIQNKVYTVKEFNELLTQADKDFHNRKEYAEKKYGSAERYWDLQDTDKLPEEDKNISFGYDKTSFKLLNFPSIENQEDTYSYEANRYDIGDGNGSVFDFIRATCSHDQVIESCNKVEKELYYPDITKEQQAFIENAVKEEKIALKRNLVEKMAALDSAQFEYNELHKKWLIESSEAERVDEQIDKALSDIKATYDNSISNLYTKVLNEYPYASTKNIYDSQFMLYTANEAKKMVLSELYLPSRDNKKYTSNDWEKFRKIFEQFPAIVNMTEYVENILQEKCNEKGYSVSENIDHNVANKIKTDSKQIATNYVLEKLAAAGIEVVTDKTIFEEILNTSELLQKMTDNKPNVNVSDIYFTADKNEVLAFAKELDDFASQAKLGDKSINPLRLINVGSISPVMKVLGIADVPVEIEQSTVLKALREEPLYPNDRQGHKLSLDELKAIPQSLADPVMVFRSDSPTRKTKDSFVFFTERKDEKNRSIIIPVAVNKKFGRLVINKVSSIYGRNQEVGYVKDNIQRGNLVYFDKKRSLIWERECKVQFLAQVLPAEGSINNILSKDSLVKFLDSKKQNFVHDSKTYGFAYNGKIYLDPDLMNSEVAVHEYTHLWDNYTMKTNPELWEKGKEVFKRTSLWNEVKASSDYADIADDDNLVLSECHARIAGKVAAQVLEKIAKENGEIARDKVINWDLEVSAYVYSELSERGERLSASDFQKLNEFIVSPVKDLLNGRDVPEISVTPDKPLSMKLSPERKPGGNRGIEIFSGNVASIISGARDGSLPALPKDGFSPDGGITIRPAAVRSYLKGQVFTGLNQLVAQKKAAELGLKPDARGSINVITYRQAGEKNIRKGTPHFDLTSYDGANNRMNYYHLYSVKGIIDESKLPPLHKPLVIPSAVIKAEDPDIAPVDYLASYEAATKAGCQFRTNRKTVEAVREKLISMEKELMKTENYNSLSASISSRSKKIILDKARNINAELHPRTRCNDLSVDR